MIVTFYSYKGGVGRTQLLSNIASYLCYYKQRKVLIIDWDMEAPGVDFFFKIKRTKINAGLLDLFSEYNKIVRSNENIKETDLPSILEDEKYIIKLIKSKYGDGKVDLIPAGKYDKSYIKNINQFDWYNFYENLDGKYYIEILKEELLKSEYDYVFIDSRTGTNDYSGICNIQMPTVNVFVVAPTYQNFQGSSDIIQNIKNSPYVTKKLRQPIIIPILSRLDRSDKISGKWFGKFRNTFEQNIIDLYTHLGTEANKTQINEYIENTLIEYKTEISYGEKLLFSDTIKEIEYTTLERQFQEITDYIERFNMKIEFEKINEIKHEILTFNAKKIEIIIKKIRELFKFSKYRRDIILYESRFKQNKENKISGIISLQEINIESNKILSGLLDILYKYEISSKTKFKKYDINLAGNGNIILQDVKSKTITIREKQLYELIAQSYVLLNEYQTRLITEADPREKMRNQIEIKRIKDLIEINKQELKEVSE